MPNAEYSEIDINLKAKVTGVDKIKELSDAVEGSKEALGEYEKQAEKTSKTMNVLGKAEDVFNKSKSALLQDIADSKKSSINKMLEKDDYDPGAVARGVLAYRKARENFRKESALENPSISPGEAGEIARQRTQLSLLEDQASAVERRLAELHNIGADPGRIAKEEAAYQKLIDKIDRAREAELERQSAAEPVSGIDVSTEQFDQEVPKAESFLSKLRELIDAKSTLATVANGAKGAVSKFGDALAALHTKGKKATSFLSKLVESFKRILFYRMIRTVIREIGQAFQEGINNAYQWSKAFGGEFSSSMDSLATSALYLKNALGAMVSPLINALAPAIDFIIDRFVALINVINQFLAAITGAGTWTKAIKYPTEYAKAAKGAGDATKKFGLAGIDQLTILSKASNGAGSAGGMDYSKMFETVELKGSIWEKIKKAIEEGDWRGLGKLLGEKFNEIVADLDAKSVGRKIGSAINSAIQFAYGFLKEADFRVVGQKIAQFINGSLESINFTTLGRVIALGFTTMWDTAIGFLSELDWGLLARKLSSFLEGAFDELTIWLQGFDGKEVGEGIYNRFIDFVGNVEWGGVAEKLFGLLGTAIGTGVSAVAGFVESAVKDIKGYFLQYMEDDNFDGKIDFWEFISGFFKGMDELDNSIGEFITEKVVIPFLDWLLKGLGIEGGLDGVYDIGEKAINGFLKGIEDAVEIGKWIQENVVDPFVKWFKELFGIHSPSKVMIDIGKDVIDGFFEGIKEAWTAIPKWIDEKVKEIGETFKKKWEEVSTNTKEKWDEITGKLGTAWEGIKTDAGTKWEGIKGTISDKWTAIKRDATDNSGTLKSNVEEKFTKLKGEIEKIWGNVDSDAEKKWKSIGKTIEEKAGTTKTNVEKKFSDLDTNIGKKLDDTDRTVDTKCNNIYKTFERQIESIKGLMKFDWKLPDIKLPHFSISGSFSLNPPSIPSIDVDWYANGGFPDSGQLFIANEAGAEMVGSMDGRTAVANNQDIVAGIEEGVYRATSAAMREGGFVAQVYLDGKQISGTVIKNVNSETRRTGRSPLLSY